MGIPTPNTGQKNAIWIEDDNRSTAINHTIGLGTLQLGHVPETSPPVEKDDIAINTAAL